MNFDLNSVGGLSTGLSGLSPIVGAATSFIPGVAGLGQLQDAGDINVLLGLAARTKESLLKTALLYAEMAALSLAFVTTSKMLKVKMNKRIKKDQEHTAEISEKYRDEEEHTIEKDHKRVDDKINNQDSSKLFGTVQSAVDSYLKIEVPDDSKYEIPKSTDIGDRGNFFGHTDATKQANSGKNAQATNGTPIPTFPIFGQPFDNLTQAITDKMNNLTEFETSKEDAAVKTNKLYKGWVVQDKNGKWIPDPIRTFTPNTPFSEVISKTMKAEYSKPTKQPPGTVKFFIEKLHGRYADGSTYQKGKIESQYEVSGGNGQNNLSNRMIFPAYIDNFNDSFSSQWSSYSFIGRGEDVPIYKSTKRTMTLSFSIIADYSIDLLSAMEKVYTELNQKSQYDVRLEEILKSTQDYGLGYVAVPGREGTGQLIGSHIPGKYSDTTETLWSKMTFLAQCMYPFYRSDGKMKEQPMIRLRLGDFYDVVGYMENMTVDTSEYDNTLDLNPTAIGNIPFAAKINMSIAVFHDNEPASNFYGFYHRREFDSGEMDPITGENISKDSKGVIAEGSQKNSPLSFNMGSLNEKLTEMPAILKKTETFKNSLMDFKTNFGELSKIGLNLQEKLRKEKIAKAMKSYVRVSEVANQLRGLYGLSQSKETGGIPDNLGGLANDIKSGNSNALINFGSITEQSNMNVISNKIAQDKLYGTNPSGLNSLKQTAMTKANGDVVKEAYENAKNQMGSAQNTPKTFSDILNITKKV